MDIESAATAFVAAQASQLQLAVAARMMRMNADQASNVVQLLEAAQQNLDRLANVVAGVGGNLDISA